MFHPASFSGSLYSCSMYLHWGQPLTRIRILSDSCALLSALMASLILISNNSGWPGDRLGQVIVINLICHGFFSRVILSIDCYVVYFRFAALCQCDTLQTAISQIARWHPPLSMLFVGIILWAFGLAVHFVMPFYVDVKSSQVAWITNVLFLYIEVPCLIGYHLFYVFLVRRTVQAITQHNAIFGVPGLSKKIREIAFRAMFHAAVVAIGLTLSLFPFFNHVATKELFPQVSLHIFLNFKTWSISSIVPRSWMEEPEHSPHDDHFSNHMEEPLNTLPEHYKKEVDVVVS
jgi:hypothetical protein